MFSLVRRRDPQRHTEEGIQKYILFHPDYDRRLRNHTGSARPLPRQTAWTWHVRALAGLPLRLCRKWLTAGGEFHPALRMTLMVLIDSPGRATTHHKGAATTPETIGWLRPRTRLACVRCRISRRECR